MRVQGYKGERVQRMQGCSTRGVRVQGVQVQGCEATSMHGNNGIRGGRVQGV